MNIRYPIYEGVYRILTAERGTEFLWERSTKKPENRQGQEQKGGSPEKTQKPEKRTYARKSKITPKM